MKEPERKYLTDFGLTEQETIELTDEILAFVREKVNQLPPGCTIECTIWAPNEVYPKWILYQAMSSMSL